MARSNVALKGITNPQKRHIYAMARELGLDDEMLHGLVFSIVKKEHISDLTVDEAISVIDTLKSNMRGTQRLKPKQKEPEAPRIGMASEAQIKKIYRLMYEIKNYDKPGEPSVSIKKRLRGVLKKYQKIDDVRFLSAAEAWKVIEELKKMVANEKRKANQ